MKYLKFNWRYAAILAGLFVLAYLVMDFNSRMAELRQLTVERGSVAAEVTSLERTKVYLQTQIAYATSEGAVVEWAYQSGHLVRPGDNPVVPMAPPGSTPPPDAYTNGHPTSRQQLANVDVVICRYEPRTE